MPNQQILGLFSILTKESFFSKTEMKKMSVSVKIAIYSISEHLDGKKMSNVVIESQNFVT